jgi:AraC-like DNA-binding protein
METVREQRRRIADASGYSIALDELAFNEIGLKWGSYVCPEEKVLSFQPASTNIVSHFLLSDSPHGLQREHLRERQFVVYTEVAKGYEIRVAPTQKEKPRSFFELMLSEDFFDRLFTEESRFLTHFKRSTAATGPSFDFTAHITPAMQGLIGDMQQAPYSGYLKGVYLEAKAIELFLMEIDQLDKAAGKQASKLRSQDIEALYDIKMYIDQHFHLPCPIIDLARRAGMNQTKLKCGFRELFATTVFGYLSDVRMREAKRLLSEEQKGVGEVADLVGYKYPQHFAAAFKRRFGMTPQSYRI